MKKPIISIVGRHQSGKTTLLVKLVKELAGRGYRIGTIKHASQDFSIDHPGKDSYRHFHAGSISTLLSSGKKLALVKNLSQPLKLDKIVRTFFDDVDLVLAEGFKRAGKPKIEVVRSRISKTPLCHPRRDKLVALASDVKLTNYPLPSFKLNQIKLIADFIEEEFLCGTKRKK